MCIYDTENKIPDMFSNYHVYLLTDDLFNNTVEPLLSGLMTDCSWPDNKKSWIIEDDPKTTC
jgi:hypothetical protein